MHPENHAMSFNQVATTARRKSRPMKAGSWRVARRMKCPSPEERRRSYALLKTEFFRAPISDAMRIGEDGKVFLRWDLYFALVETLTTVALPADRYRAWLSHGVYEDDEIDPILRGFNISADRIEQIRNALFSIEPYPSKRPIESIQVDLALRSAGLSYE